MRFMEAGLDLSLQLRLPNSCEPTISDSTVDHDQELGWPSTELRLFPIPSVIKGVPVYQPRPFPFSGGNEASTLSERTSPICSSSSSRLAESVLHRVGGAFSQRREAPAMTSWFSPGLRRTSASTEMLFRHHHHRYQQELAAMMRSSLGKRNTRAPRMRWTGCLHSRFIHAVELLGGHERATPKSVLELMDVKDLTLAHVKSHLQMYRTIKTSEKASAFTGHFYQNSEKETHHISNGKDQKRMTENREGTLHSPSSSSTRMETSSSEVEDPEPSDHFQNRSGDQTETVVEELSTPSKDPNLNFTLGRADKGCDFTLG